MTTLRAARQPATIVAIWLVTAGCCAAALLAPRISAATPVVSGEPAPRTVVAPQPVTVTDPVATDLARREAAAAITPVVRLDRTAQQALLDTVADALDRAVQARQPVPTVPAGPLSRPGPTPPADATPGRDAQIAALTGRIPGVDPAGIAVLVDLPDAELAGLTDDILEVARRLAARRITDDTLEQNRADIPALLGAQGTAPAVADAIAIPLLTAATQPTWTVDVDATDAARTDAANQVEPVVRTYVAGEPVVQAGQEADDLHVEVLAALGLAGTSTWDLVGPSAILLAVTFLLVAVAVTTADGTRPRRHLVIATLTVLLAAATTAATTVGDPWTWAIPAAGIVTVATQLGRDRAAWALVVAAPALTYVAVPSRTDVVAGAVLAAALGTLAGQTPDRRAAATIATIGAAATTGTVTAVTATAHTGAILTAIAAAGAGTLTALAILAAVRPAMEYSFDTTSTARLLTLTDRSHPLLRQLETDAIGTYSHSVQVADLTQRACQAIGADGLLGAVMALYHDVGKLAAPSWFIENQRGHNPHDQLADPEQSARRIIAHVDDGLQMARDHRLPEEVIDGIASHHGDTVVAYFHHQACAAAGQPVDDTPFRYPHPTPTSPEATVLMLADSCEAAARATSLRQPLDGPAIVELVDRIVDGKVADGQLRNSALTHAQTVTVRRSLAESLAGIYHTRVAYPTGRT